MSEKNVLIVYAHPELNSFNGALKEVTIKTLKDAGHHVKVSDLYSMQFKATTTKDDVLGNFKEQPFQYINETKSAYKEGRLSSDIVAEIEKLDWADLVVFQFPVQWFGPPAILKGWFDRVLVCGKTFSFPDKVYSTGVYKGRRAILSCTAGSPESLYQPNGIHGDINVMLWPIENGVLNFLGFSVLKANVCFGIPSASQEDREKMLKSWEARIPGLFQETPQKFFSRDDFEYSGFGSLKPEVLKQAVKDGEVPIGHRRAVPLPEEIGGTSVKSKLP